MIRETTPALYAIKLLEEMAALGCSPQALIREHGFTAGELTAPAREIPLDKYLALVSACVSQAGVDDLGFRVGEHTSLLEHGALGYALISSHSLEASLRRYVRYQAIVGPLQRVSLEAGESVARMVVTPIQRAETLPSAVQAYFLQEWLATWNPWCQLIDRPGSFFRSVTIGLPGAAAGTYSRHLLCPVDIAPGPTLAEFPTDRLQLPLHFSDVRTGAFCREQCELLLQALEARHGLTAEIHRQLARTPGQLPGMEDVASRLGMTTRTLRRRLLAEDTSFQAIVIGHRIGLAKRYLRETPLPTEEIATLIGYADAANFYRMFRQAESMTPARFRARTTSD